MALRPGFGAERRRRANQHTPEVRAMGAVADLYGPGDGTPASTQQFADLFDTFIAQAPDPLDPMLYRAGPVVADEARGSRYPLAAHAAWAAAALMPNPVLVSTNASLGNRGLILGASLFSDTFPGLVKMPVLGERIRLWRSPAALAVVMLRAHADALDLQY